MHELYKGIVSPWLNKRDSELWHDRTRQALHLVELNPVTLWLLEKIVGNTEKLKDKRLSVVVGGIEFENPLLVGAGWDKKGKAVQSLRAMGFAGVEVGTVVAFPQEGNQKPRQWMLTSGGVAMNRLGFNSPGMEAVAKNLKRYRGKGIPIGISIGKNKDIPNIDAPQAHAIVAEKLYDEASYFVINVSSPNTPGLRELQDKGPLTDIIQAVNNVMDLKGLRKPLFVKIAPDLTDAEVDCVIQVVIDKGLTGIIATNTTNSDRIKDKYGRAGEIGGISGSDPEYRNMSTEKIRHIYKQVGGLISIIGVGGIDDGRTALEKIFAGATMLQIVTGIRGRGPTVAVDINRDLIKFMNENGIIKITDLVGATLNNPKV